MTRHQITCQLSGLTNRGSTIEDTSTARTLSVGDSHKYIRLTNAGAITITVPNQDDEPWGRSTEIYFRRAATAGVITLTPAAGVTLNNAALVADIEPHGNFAIKKIAENIWDVI